MTDLPTPSGKMTVTYEIDRKVKVPVWDEPAMRAFATAAALAEREACAKVCDDIEEVYRRRESMRHPELRSDAETGAGVCAEAIRARSKE